MLRPAALALLALLSAPHLVAAASSEPLRSGWELASSASLGAGVDGKQLSGPAGASGGGNWSQLQQFPATVLAGLVEAGEYPELYFSQNLKAVGTARFDVPWWYRVELPAEAADNAQAGGKAVLTFQGLNYRANIWVNGRLLANASVVRGAYNYFDVDASEALAAGGGTFLAVQVFRSYDWGVDCRGNLGPPNLQVSCRGKNKVQSQDLGITWVDWAPAPHDANMGLWRDIVLTTTQAHSEPPVTLRYPGVHTTLSAGNTAASITVTAEAANWGSAPLSGSVHMALGSLGKADVVHVHLPPGVATQVVVNISLSGLSPKTDLWWPWQMGAQNRHELSMSFSAASTAEGAAAQPALVSSLATLVGLRSASNSLDANNNAVFRVNGQRLLVRGGGYAPDLLQRMSQQRTRREMAITRDLGLNAIRLEGKLQDDDLFEQCDEMGAFAQLA
jgi:exo-1,4-beta-D-glucosaminidase